MEAIETQILAGNPDLQGLCLALSDWSAELRILDNQYVSFRNVKDSSKTRKSGARDGCK